MPSRGRAVIVNRGKSVRESPRKVINRFRATNSGSNGFYRTCLTSCRSSPPHVASAVAILEGLRVSGPGEGACRGGLVV